MNLFPSRSKTPSNIRENSFNKSYIDEPARPAQILTPIKHKNINVNNKSVILETEPKYLNSMNPDHRSLHEHLSNQQNQKLHDKIRQRENMSQIVANRTNQIRNKEKEELILKNENDIFSLYKNRHDPIKIRAFERIKKTELITKNYAKWIKNEKYDVSEYYKKCVDNVDLPEHKPDPKLKIIPKDEFKSVLEAQIEEKKKNRFIMKSEEKVYAKDYFELIQKKDEEDRINRKLNEKKLKEDFAKNNLRLLAIKQKNEEIEKNKKLYEEKKIGKLIEEEMKKSYVKNYEYKKIEKDHLSNVLKMQMLDKKK